MRMPNIKPIAQYKTCIDAFNGYYHNIRCGEDKLYDITNMTLDKYPSIATREKYKELLSIEAEPAEDQTVMVNGMISYGDEFLYTVGDTVGDVAPFTSNKLGVYHLDGAEEPELMHEFSISTDGAHASVERQLCIMGGRLLIFPDALYMDIANPSDAGSITNKEYPDEVAYTLTGGGYTLTASGPNGETVYRSKYIPDPADMGGAEYWLRMTDFQMFHLETGVMVPCNGYVTLVDSLGNADFTDMDGVAEGGYIVFENAPEGMNGIKYEVYDIFNEHVLRLIGPYTATAATTQKTTLKFNAVGAPAPVPLPSMDFVFECGNRLWGCHFGNFGGKILDEIYCSGLGDFTRWATTENAFNGTVMDPWAATRSGDGPYTGAINYNGTPLFFKQKSMTKVTGTEPSNFTVVEYPCDGVMPDASKSLAIVNGTLFYKSNKGVAYYDGSLPRDMSDAFCGLLEYVPEDWSRTLGDCYGASLNNKYYLAVDFGTFIYDTKSGIWTKYENATITNGLCAHKSALFESGERVITEVVDGVSTTTRYSKIYLVDGHIDMTLTARPINKWSMETGYIFATKSKYSNHTADRMYLTKITVRASFTGGTGDTFKMYVNYDDEKANNATKWEEVASLEPCVIKSRTIHFVPRRVDRLRLKFEGSGSAEILSITKTVERGSDVTW